MFHMILMKELAFLVEPFLKGSTLSDESGLEQKMSPSKVARTFPRMALSVFSVVLDVERLERFRTHCVFSVGVWKKPGMKSSRRAELVV